MVELAQEGMTMLCAPHGMGFMKKVADKIVFMGQRTVDEETPKDTFFVTPQSERAGDFLTKILH